MTNFTDFKHHRVPVTSPVCSDVTTACRTAGSGPGLLLLHGYPQTSHIWRFIAPRLAEHFTVVAADLRGYGASSKPPGSDSHIEYSKREMANDMVQVMKHFGFETFDIVAHDRGARVAHRLALDHPAAVKRMALLDIAPTLYMYEHTDMKFATAYWHWFWLIQPNPLPENVMLADPDRFWELAFGGRPSQSARLLAGNWSAADIEEYRKPLFTPEGVHAACEDYRAAATIDLEHDRASIAEGKKLAVESLLLLWGSKGFISTYDDPVGIWRGYCHDTVTVTGHATDCGHFVPEDAVEEVMAHLRTLFAL